MTSENDGASDNATQRAETLYGSIRDNVLREFKTMEKPWAKMTEVEQERIIHRAGDIASQVVRGAVAIVADEGFENVRVTIAQFTVKDGIKIQLTASNYLESVTALAAHGHSAAVLVLAEPSKFMGEENPAEPDNVGDLGMPKEGASDGQNEGEDGERADQQALEQVGRGEPRRRGRPPKNQEAAPPTSELPAVDTSSPPFGMGDEPAVADPVIPEAPAVPA